MNDSITLLGYNEVLAYPCLNEVSLVRYYRTVGAAIVIRPYIFQAVARAQCPVVPQAAVTAIDPLMPNRWIKVLPFVHFGHQGKLPGASCPKKRKQTANGKQFTENLSDVASLLSTIVLKCNTHSLL